MYISLQDICILINGIPIFIDTHKKKEKDVMFFRMYKEKHI